MSEETATLRDAIVEPSTESVETKPTETSAPATTTTPEVADTEAAELGKLLLESGVTKAQVNDLLQAPKALDAIRYAIQNDPQEFLKMLERNDPKTGEKFLETMADTYVTRFGDKNKPEGGKKDANSELMREVEVLREKTNRLETEQQRRDQASAVAQVKARYDARVEDMLTQDGIKELGLTKAETKAVRARLDKELGADPTVVQRISNGNFVDVPRTFKTIIDEWASDRKSATEAAKAQRERSSRGAFPEFQPGANAFLQNLPQGFADSWDATEEAFAKGLEAFKE